MRLSTFSRGAPRRAIFLKSGAIALALAAFAPAETENAVANGDTRTISLYHSHTQESITATFRVNGAYDYATLEKLNWFLRDWRRDEPTKMDPRLFDAVWETYRETGSQQPIVIVSAYRSPETNAMLRRRSRAVAEFSQHMLGKAMDMHYQDVPMSRVREIAMHLQRGGVGYYPTAGSPFVHMDVGSVRAWPRMTYDQLARLFPDGKTVHLPSNGQPLARYEEARAEIESRNGVSVPTIAQVRSKGFFETLFGGGEDDKVVAAAPAGGGPRVGGDNRVAGFIEKSRGSNAATRLAAARAGGATAYAPSATGVDENNAAGFFVADANRQSPAVARAEQNLPRGETYVSPAPVVVAARAEPQKPTVLPEPSQPAAAIVKPAPEPDAAQAVVAPIPPRRPTELALNLPQTVVAPLPPARPTELARAPDFGPRATRSAGLPNVIITGGTAPVAASVTGALAYAPASVIAPEAPKPAPRSLFGKVVAPVGAQPIGLRATVRDRRGEDALAHLDRANFRALTAPVEVASSSPTAVGPVVTGLRKASRNDMSGLVFAAPAGIATRFDTSASATANGSFSGPAVRPLPGWQRASLSGANPPNGIN